MNGAGGSLREVATSPDAVAGVHDSGPLLYRTARALFLKRGFHAVSLRQLADEMGLHAGSLYHHIDSKQTLLFDLLEEYESSLVAGLKYCRGTNPISQLESYVKRYLQIVMQQQEAARLSALEHRSLTGHQQEEIAQLRHQWQRVLDVILEDGLREGVFEYDLLEFTRASIIAALHHLATWEGPDVTTGQRGHALVLRMLARSQNGCAVHKKQ